MLSKAKIKRNYYVSYLKGWAIISIILIHLIDWSNQILTKNQLYFKELLYPGVLFFIAVAGSTIYIAYAKYDLLTAVKKSFRRGGELIAIYFLYNITKLFIYNFSVEPFYSQFIAAGKLNLINILALKSFTAPISIILTIGVFLIISPFFLWLAKMKNGKTIIGCLLAAVIAINYFLPLPAGALTDFLYAKNNITFPLALWLVPFLVGFYLGMWDLEKYKGKLFLIFSGLTIVSGLAYFKGWDEINLTGQMYPLKLFYVFFSFAFMYLLIYVFSFLEAWRNAAVNFLLSLIRLLGDYTLAIYIYHWLVIDITLWLFYPRADYILYSVPIFIAAYLVIKRKKLAEYYKSY